MLYLNYIHKGTTYTQHNQAATTSAAIIDKEFRWAEYKRFDFKKNDTLDIKLCADGVNYEDIFKSFTNSSIDIYYID